MKIRYRHIEEYKDDIRVFDCDDFNDFVGVANCLRCKNKNPLFIYREDKESKQWRKTFQREEHQFLREGRIIKEEKDCGQ